MSEQADPSQEPILDPAVFGGLQALEDSAAFLAELRLSLEETVPQVITIVKDALAAGEAEEAASALEAIRESAESIGAARLAALALRLSERLIAGPAPSGEEVAAPIQAELRAVLAALSRAQS